MGDSLHKTRGNCFCSLVFPFTRGSSQPKDRTQVSLTAGSLYQLSHKESAVSAPLPPKNHFLSSVQFSSVQSLSRVRLFATPWTAAHQASLSITNAPSLIKPMSTEWVMPSNHLILCRPLLLLPSIFPSIRVFSSESVLHIRWPFTLCKRALKLLPTSQHSVTK